MITARIDAPEAAERSKAPHLVGSYEPRYHHTKDQPCRISGKYLAKKHQGLVNIAQHFEFFFVEFGGSKQLKD